MRNAERANLSQSLVDANVLLGKVHNETVSIVCSNDLKQLDLLLSEIWFCLCGDTGGFDPGVASCRSYQRRSHCMTKLNGP